MKRRSIHLEDLLGTMVHDVDGQRAGRIEEVHAKQTGRTCEVIGYAIGSQGLFERLSIPHFASVFLRLLGARKHRGVHQVRWNHMDLTDPGNPRLTIKREELKRLQD